MWKYRVSMSKIINRKLRSRVISAESFFSVILFCFIFSTSYAQLKVAKVFGSGMVLQRDKPISIWGKATPNTVVVVQTTRPSSVTNSYSITATKDSTWEISVPAQKANVQPQQWQVISERDTITFTDILIGDVWVCAGQSNMAFMLKNDQFARQTLPKTHNPNLRLLNWQSGLTTYNFAYKSEEVDRLQPKNFYSGLWQMADSNSAKDFSAVAFYFGQRIQQQTDIPIGLVHLAVGGSPCEAWMSPEAVTGSDELERIFQGNWLKNSILEPWCIERGHQNLDNLLKSNEILPQDSLGVNHPFKPSFLYKAGIEPLLKFPIKGVIWYQGESNSLSYERVKQHEKLFPRLIKDWRSKWGLGDFPFYFCQLSSIGTEKGYKSHFWPEFRDGQRQIAQKIPNLGMAVTSDVGHPWDVHPTNKKVAGERLAKIALAKTYKQKEVYAGPTFEKIAQTPSQFVLTFAHVEKGLQTTDNKPITGFLLEDRKGVKTEAKAHISGKNKIVLVNEAGRYQRILYGWKPFSDGNLANSEGLPTSTFEVKIK